MTLLVNYCLTNKHSGSVKYNAIRVGGVMCNVRTKEAMDCELKLMNLDREYFCLHSIIIGIRFFLENFRFVIE